MNNLRVILTALAGMLAVSGCAGGPAYRMGQEAEREGHAHIAYDRYLEAAKQSPDNASIAAAMRRVAPTAATYWTAQARIAHGAGRYADAWRAAMRALDIRPDQEEARQLVHMLENEQPEAIHPVRMAWMRRGTGALPAAPGAGAPAAPPAREGPTVASIAPPPDSWEPDVAEPRREAQPRPQPEPPPPVAKAPATPHRIADARPAAREQPAERTPSVAAGAPRERDAAPPSRSRSRTTRVEIDSAPTASARERRLAEYPRPSPRPVLVGSETRADYGEPVLVLTLSERDRQMERRVPLLEGITVELCDVDDDDGGEVDLDLFDGNRRISKIRELGVGKSRLFRSGSGAWYRLRVNRMREKPALVELVVLLAS